MPLTAEEKSNWLKVIANTNFPKKDRIVPTDYSAYLEQVDRSEVTIPVSEPGVPVKCIISAAKDKTKNCPVHVNFHGGGFHFPQNEDDDLYCAHVAVCTRGIAVDVDYALSPDYSFPVAFEQAYAAVAWAFSQCGNWEADSKRVSVGGHSAGGNLTAAVMLRAAATRDFQPCLQILDYAALDTYRPMEISANSPCAGEDPWAMRSKAFSMMYGGGDLSALKSPYCSPNHALDEMLTGLAPALVISAGQCPFCDENEEYALRMAARGVEVTLKRFLNSRHGFTVRMMDEWREAQELIIRAINEARL